jgi:hypothetical protein
MGFGVKNFMNRSELTILRLPERIMLVPNARQRRQGVDKQKRICLVASATSSSPPRMPALSSSNFLSMLPTARTRHGTQWAGSPFFVVLSVQCIVRCVPGFRPRGTNFERALFSVPTAARRRFPPSAPIRKVSMRLGREKISHQRYCTQIRCSS